MKARLPALFPVLSLLSCFSLPVAARAAAPVVEPGLSTQPPIRPRADAPGSSEAVEGAKEPAITVGMGTDVVSRYVSRGVACSDGAALQSSVWASSRDLTLTVWNNLSLAQADRRGRVSEWDTTLAWTRPWRDVAVELAATRYDYPNDSARSWEGSLRLTRAFGAYEAYALNVVDIDAFPGAWMAEIGASRGWDLSSRLAIEATVSLMWGNRRFQRANAGAEDAGIGAIGAALSLPMDIGAGLSLRPHLEWNELPDHRIRSAVGDRRYFTIGLALETND